MSVVVTFVTYIIILSADLVADKNLPDAVKEFEVVNKNIAFVDISLFLRADLCHSSYMQ